MDTYYLEQYILEEFYNGKIGYKAICFLVLPKSPFISILLVEFNTFIGWLNKVVNRKTNSI